jgi:formylglycine-generating enzyme required for sulfatase activity
MARPRQLLPGILACLCLAACGEGEHARAPSASAGRPSPVAQNPAPAKRLEGKAPAVQWRPNVPVIDAGAAEATLRQADAALARGQVDRGRSPGPGALELYMAVQAVQPQDARALAGVQASVDAMLELGRLAMRAGRLDEAARAEAIAAIAAPAHPDLPHFRGRLAQARLAQRELQLGERAAGEGDITLPARRSALDHLQRARTAFPDYEPIAAAQLRWNRVLLQRAWSAAGKDDFAAADSWLAESARLAPGNAESRVMRLRIIEFRQARTDAALAAGNAAVDALKLPQAEAALAQAARVAAQPAGVAALRQRIHLAHHYGHFQPRQAFSEKLALGGNAPEMVVVPYGRFRMGAGEDDPQRQDQEAPAHEVSFRRGFAIARNETTVAEFGRFVAATKYRSSATRAGHSTVYDEKGGAFAEHEGVDWRRDHVGRIASPALPVVHVSFDDATAYAHWLSRQTGQRYRLPSEAEFEYALRGGSEGIYPWGDDDKPKSVVGNLAGDGDLSTVARHWGNAIPGYRDAFWGPAPVRNFAAERFGTYDLIGNVSEWTLDCWHVGYQRAPSDGSAWLNPGCRMRTVRGASWASSLEQVRSASRQPMAPETSSARLGFRVVREL